MRIEYNLSKQEKSYFCVPAVFQAILRRHGHETSQEDLADSLTVTEFTGALINKNFFRLFEKYELKNNFMRTNEVFMQDPIFLIDEWEKTNGDMYILYGKDQHLGHINLIIERDDRNVVLKDPADLKETIENLEELYASIAKTGIGGFGLITKL